MPAPAASMVTVPQQYVGQVKWAAQQLRIPEAVVAAQLNLESGFNPQATSNAGAQGIAQFEPGTWRDLRCGGSPFNAGAAFKCYVTYMHQLLTMSHGNVRQALAAYNAGPQNIAAGYGYADVILNAAHVNGGKVITGYGSGSQSSTSGSQGDTSGGVNTDTLWGIPRFGFGPFGIGPIALLTKSNARAWVAVGLMGAGAIMAIPAIAITAAAAGAKLGGGLGKSAGGVTEAVGAGVSLFAPEVGVPLAAAGRQVKQQGATKAATRAATRRGERQRRERRAADADAERKAGNLGGESSARAGESPGFAARNRTASGRPRPESSRQRAARYGKSSGRPAPASETGF